MNVKVFNLNKLNKLISLVWNHNKCRCERKELVNWIPHKDDYM